MASPVSALTSSSDPTANPSTAGGITAASGGSEQVFLQLLVSQIQNQDPLNPMDDTQSVAELAQFSSLQATTNMATNFADFESNFAVSQASGLLGDKVTVATTDSAGNSSTVSGTVKSIQVVNGTPEFTMVDSSGNAIVDSNGSPIEFTTSQITAISQ